MLKIIYAKTNKDSAEHLLKSLVSRDKTQKHIVFTPDRANLIYQNSIFDLINEECLFDVDVTTISRFASRFATAEKVLSKQGGVAIVKKILIENETRFLAFGRSVRYKGFALSLFETLCMFKSCRILPENISETKNGVFNNKLHDIKIVYEEYEKFLQKDYTDSFNILSLCASKIDKSFKDTNFYFVGFEDFTKQGLYLIEKMMKYANNVFVATTYGKKGINNNYNLYDNAIMGCLIDIAKVNGLKYDLISAKSDENQVRNVLKNNLFAYTQSHKCTTDNIRIFAYNNRKDEVNNTVNYIRNQVQKKGFRYSDFTILVPKIDAYKQYLKEAFDKFGISYYFDENKCFADNIIARYVLSLVKVVLDYNEIFNIINTPFFILEDDKRNAFIDYVEKYGIVGRALIENEYLSSNYINSLTTYIQDMRREANIKGFVSVVASAVEKFAFEQLENYQNQLYDAGLLEEYKKVPQCINILQKTFDQLSDVLGDYECSYKTFVEIFENYINNINFTLPPIVAESVFVGEIETSFVQNTDNLFVLGCNEGVVPAYNMELGLISDKEIGLMPQKYRLNPTIEEINRRKKFKVFENIVSFNEKLYLSYLSVIDKNKGFSASFVDDVRELFGIEEVDGSYWLNNVYANFDGLNEVLVEFDNMSQKSIDFNFAEQLKNYEFLKDNVSYLQYLSLLASLANDKILSNYAYRNEINNLDEKLFLKKGTIGVSEIERFNCCPYKHFVEYGLKIRDKERSNFEAIDNGQIIHEFLKLVVPKLKKDQDCDLDILVDEELGVVLSKKEYEHLVKNENNKANIKALHNECRRILDGIVYQLQNSSFEPLRFEQPFKYSVGGLKVDGNEIALVGVIDRIDKWQNYFTIIDYKTGSSKMDNFDEVKSGEKWQLIVYMYVVGQGSLKPAGCFYMPIKNDFTTKEKYGYQLQGLINRDIDVITALDNNLEGMNHNSKIVKLETNDKGLKENVYYKTMCLSDEDIADLNDWVMKKVVEKVESILKGEIRPYPLMSGGKSACDYCKYIGLCHYNKLYGNEPNVAEKCKTLDDLLGEVCDE